MSILDLTNDVHKQRRPTGLSRIPDHPIDAHRNRFSARLNYLHIGLAVVCTETATDVWDITTSPGTLVISTGGDGVPVGEDTNIADFVFYGTNTYEISNNVLGDALVTAGYTVTGIEYASTYSTLYST